MTPKTRGERPISTHYSASINGHPMGTVMNEVNEEDDLSIDLSEEENKNQHLSDIEKFDMLAAKHRFQDVGKILHVSIIDFLTSYTCVKRVELAGKSLTAPAETVSVAHPNFYGDRFKDFIIKRVLADKI